VPHERVNAVDFDCYGCYDSICILKGGFNFDESQKLATIV
jgi:hypothetical protein